MNDDQILLEKHLRKTTITANVISILVALFVAMSVGYGFYYNTKSTLETHSTDIKEIKDDVKEVKNSQHGIDLFQGVSTVEIKALEKKVDKQQTKMEKMDDKLDRILLQTR
jgi:uncharacterized protein HemX